MRFVRETSRRECEQQRQAQRSRLKAWLDVSGSLHAAVSSPNAQAPALPPSLKKPTAAPRWGLNLHKKKDEKLKRKAKNNDPRCVHFDEDKLCEKWELPAWTDEELAQCHYSQEELGGMAASAKKSLRRESRAAAQSTDTILEQGYLTMQASTPFFQPRQLYCLLRGYHMAFFASAAHAARAATPKSEFAVLRVQDVTTMSMQKKIAMFGANLPDQIGLMFYVIKSNGERVVLTAESKSAKRNWVHTLTRVTYVGEGSCFVTVGVEATTASRHRSSSAPAACKTSSMRKDLPQIVEEGEEEPETVDNQTQKQQQEIVRSETKMRRASVDFAGATAVPVC